LNNPLSLTDSSGHDPYWDLIALGTLNSTPGYSSNPIVSATATTILNQVNIGPVSVPSENNWTIEGFVLGRMEGRRDVVLSLLNSISNPSSMWDGLSSLIFNRDETITAIKQQLSTAEGWGKFSIDYEFTASTILVGMEIKTPGITGILNNTSKIKSFTYHSLDQICLRDGHGVSNTAIIDAVENPLRVALQPGETMLYEGKNATVVINRGRSLVTAWANNSKGWRYK